VLWIRVVRTNVVALFVIAHLRECRHVAGALRDRGGQSCPRLMPSAWGRYSATPWDYGVFIGSIGLFFAALFLFCPVPADDLHLRDA